MGTPLSRPRIFLPFLNCLFKIKAEEHNIEIPGLVKPKLMEYTPLDATVGFKLN